MVRREKCASRADARRMIEAGLVEVEGMADVSVSTLVAPQARITVAVGGPRFVSRGGHKLDGALEALDVQVEGRCWLDAGASTGGFTDRLLQGGARKVIAVDVGYGQLAWELRQNECVHVLERTNVRHLTPADLPELPDGVVADLSFISLRTVLPALASCVANDGDMILMVKPQFEVGREQVGRGVVRDPQLWREAVAGVVEFAGGIGWGLAGGAPSPLPGPSGNREFFIHLRRGAEGGGDAIDRLIEEAR